MTEAAIQFGTSHGSLEPCPINSDWILSGKPVTRGKPLAQSEDGSASSCIWECTHGRFNWFYDCDETIYVIEGGVVVKGPDGTSRTLRAGDTAFFPAGSRAEWNVPHYILKIAFLRSPLPRSYLFAKRIYHGLKWHIRHLIPAAMIRGKASKASTGGNPSMIRGG